MGGEIRGAIRGARPIGSRGHRSATEPLGDRDPLRDGGRRSMLRLGAALRRLDLAPGAIGVRAQILGIQLHANDPNHVVGIEQPSLAVAHGPVTLGPGPGVLTQAGLRSN